MKPQGLSKRYMMGNDMKTFYIDNLGCSKNQVDSEIMHGLLLEAGYEYKNEASNADIVIINTCGFIEASKIESLDVIFDYITMKTDGEIKKVIVAGCLAQRYHEELKDEIKEVDAFIGTGDYHRIVELIENSKLGIPVYMDLMNELTPEGLPRVLMNDNHYAYVKISEGCDNRCTYCIIPMLRGSFRSRKIEDIKSEIISLVKGGVKEAILIAQDTTRYGMDLYGGYALPKLLDELQEIEGLEWIRIQYAYPDVISDEMIDAIARNSKVVKYIDIPIQHGSNRILKLMNRHTTREDIISVIGKMRDRIPGIRLRTTVMVGFPGETEDDFNQLMELASEIRFDRLGAFEYSDEEGTPAMKLPDKVEEEVAGERFRKLMELQMSISEQLNSAMVGKVLDVIIDEKMDNESIYIGRTEYDTPEVDGVVYVHTEKNLSRGDIVKVKIEQYMEYDLVGGVFDEPGK